MLDAGGIMGFLHSSLCKKHLEKEYVSVYYGSFCPDCDERFRLEPPSFEEVN